MEKIYFKILFILSTLTILCCLAIGAEQLVLVVEDDAAPWSKKDGTGYANELVCAIYKAVNIDVELTVQPYARCKMETLKGTYAGCFNMAKIPDLENEIVFSEIPLFLAYNSYFYYKERPLNAKTENDLPEGIKVGTVIGYEYSDLYYKLKKEGRISVQETRSEVQNLKKLERGRVDTVILWHNETKPAESIIERAGLKGKINKAFRSKTIELHIGFSKKHHQSKLALENYEKGYRIIKSNGVYQQITDKWVKKAFSKTD